MSYTMRDRLCPPVEAAATGSPCFLSQSGNTHAHISVVIDPEYLAGVLGDVSKQTVSARARVDYQTACRRFLPGHLYTSVGSPDVLV